MFRIPERTMIADNVMGKKGLKMVSLRSKMIITLVLISVLTFGFAKTPLAKGKNAEAPLMTKERLREMLGNPEVIILDVRVDREWGESKAKIQGAIREDPWKGIESWAKKYPQEKTLVLYCS